MDNSSPLTSQSLSKENDSIDDASAAAKQAAERRAAKSEDDFEDSLNVSISEHISEEIESNNNSSAVDDSIERPPLLFNQSIAEKKRQLFDFDDSDRSDARDGGDGDGQRMFSKFNLDESLSGENIAKHFATETAETAAATTTSTLASTSTAAVTQSSVNEPVASQNISQRTIKSDELKIADVNEGAAVTTAMTATVTTPIPEATTSSSKTIDDVQKSKDSSNLIELTQQSSDNHKSVSDDKTNGKNDVILINDREISIHSLMELQKQPSRTDIANQCNQNTTSDISDLQAEDNAKEQQSIDDISTNESSEKVESHSATGDVEVDRSKSVSDKVQSDPKSDSQSEKNETSTNNNDEIIQKCHPIEVDESLPEPLSVIEEVSAADEQSSHHQLIESNSDKKIEMRKILDDTIDKLPLDKENRPPGEDLLSIGSKYLGSSQNSTTTDGTVYTAFGKSSEVPPILPTNFGDGFDLNLIKTKELQNVAGKTSSASYFDFPLISSSRRDSLKDFAQSGRESSSITTNSTEYQAFQEEFTRVSILNIIFGRSIQIVNSNSYFVYFFRV